YPPDSLITYTTFFRSAEACLIFPIRLSDPLQLLFIVAIKRIVNQFVVHQIRVHTTRNRRRVPRSCSHLAKLPVCVQEQFGLSFGDRTSTRLNSSHHIN